PSFVAYPAGAVYDGLWIFALLGEWLAQFQPRPRRAARLTGAAFMLGSMGAIVAASAHRHALLVGLIAALIPLGVKLAWWLRFELTTHRLSPDAQFLVDGKREEAFTALALEINRRELDAAEALTRELRAARNHGLPDQVPAVPDQVPEQWFSPVPDRVPSVPEFAELPHAPEVPELPEPQVTAVPEPSGTPLPVPVHTPVPQVPEPARNRFGTDVDNR